MKRLLVVALVAGLVSWGVVAAKPESALAMNDSRWLGCETGWGCQIQGVMSYGYALTTVYGYNYSTGQSVSNITMTVCMKSYGCQFSVTVPGEPNVGRYSVNISTTGFGVILSAVCIPGGTAGGGGGGGVW